MRPIPAAGGTAEYALRTLGNEYLVRPVGECRKPAPTAFHRGRLGIEGHMPMQHIVVVDLDKGGQIRLTPASDDDLQHAACLRVRPVTPHHSRPGPACNGK